MTLEEEIKDALQEAWWNLPDRPTHGQVLAAYARAAIAVIQARCEAAGAEKERAAAAAWLPSQDRGDEYMEYVARAVKAGEHRKDEV